MLFWVEYVIFDLIYDHYILKLLRWPTNIYIYQCCCLQLAVMLCHHISKEAQFCHRFGGKQGGAAGLGAEGRTVIQGMRAGEWSEAK